MFTIGGSSGIILGNAAVDLALHDTYYVAAHFHFVLSLGAVIAIFSSIIFQGEKLFGTQSVLSSASSSLCIYHFVIALLGILLTFVPMHFLGFNLMPRRIPDFPDTFHSWNFLSSIGSGITLLSFLMLNYFVTFTLVEHPLYFCYLLSAFIFGVTGTLISVILKWLTFILLNSSFIS